MAKTWRLIRVELLGGRGLDLWPRPGRVMVIGPHHTFADLAAAIDAAFARWDRSHLSRFDLADGTAFAYPDPDDEPPVTDMREALVLQHMQPGAPFRYLFDYGDEWVHRCEMEPRKVDPVETLGIEPEAPMACFGWGDLPDQYGRRWDGDDGQEPPSAPAELDPMRVFTWPDVPGWALASTSPALTFDDLRALRAAVGQRDGAAVVEILQGRDPTMVLQHAGDGLLVARAAGVGGVDSLVEEVAARLRQRGFEGDDELADQLTGAGSSKAVPANLESVAEVLEGDTDMYSGGWLNLITGEAWPSLHDDEFLDEEEELRAEQPEKWLWLPCQRSRDAYTDMVDFAEGLGNGPLARRLFDALEGRGAFGRFRRALDQAGDEEVGRWRAFSEERVIGRARSWLAGQGFAAEPPFDAGK